MPRLEQETYILLSIHADKSVCALYKPDQVEIDVLYSIAKLWQFIVKMSNLIYVETQQVVSVNHLIKSAAVHSYLWTKNMHC